MLTNKEKQSNVASRLNTMGWIAINPKTDEQLDALWIGEPIVMRLRLGVNRIIVFEDGRIRDYMENENANTFHTVYAT